MKYIREFIELKQDAPGYALGSTKISGNCKFEVLHGKVKIKLSLRNLRESKDTYTVDVIKTVDDKNIGVNLGQLDVMNDGRTQFIFQKELSDSLDSQVLSDFDVIVIMTQKDRSNSKRDLITPAVGYRREKLLWRQNFRYFDEEDTLKKFQLHIEDAVEEVHEEKNEDLKSQPMLEKDEAVISEEPVANHQENMKAKEKDETADSIKNEEIDQVSGEVEDLEADDQQQDIEEVIDGIEIIDSAGQSAVKGENGESGIEDIETERQGERRKDVIIKYIDYDENSCMGKKKRRITRQQEVKNLEQMKELLDIKEISYQPTEVDKQEEKKVVQTREEKLNDKGEEVLTDLREDEVVDPREEEKDENENNLETVEDIIPKRFSRKVEEMFTTYPRLKPFEEKEEEEWIRIEPRDIAIFPIGTWRLMNNPFLMNGYYKHHHILLGERLDLNEGYYYMVAVPAQYNPRQKRLANVHGFEYFRSCRNINPRTGEFGYWIKEIRI